MRAVRFLMRALDFAAFYAREIFLSNLRVAHDTLTPAHLSRPGILAVPLRVRTDLEILLLANLISFTPGTLSLDVSSDRRVLYVHVMFLDDPERTRRDITDQLEGRVLRLLRG
jgi:multicomponent Na+:H+ antiporter subunit E